VEVFKIEGTQDVPSVMLDKSAGKLEFSGRSLPEDVQEVYNPVLTWVENYVQNPNSKTHVVFKLEYFNTASSKKILDILDKLKEIPETGKELQIDWYHTDNDEDMIDAGASFSEFIDVPFNMIGY
jgi:hypothetical protein